jgi:hypothetical protein
LQKNEILKFADYIDVVKTALNKWTELGSRIATEIICFDEVLKWTKKLKTWKREFETVLKYLNYRSDRIGEIQSKISVLLKLANIEKIMCLFTKILTQMKLEGNFDTLKNLHALVRKIFFLFAFFVQIFSNPGEQIRF